MGKVRKGGRRGGERGMTTTPSHAGKVILCENCGRVGEHRSTSEVRRCYGRGVTLGRDFRWVKP